MANIDIYYQNLNLIFKFQIFSRNRMFHKAWPHSSLANVEDAKLSEKWESCRSHSEMGLSSQSVYQ
jgi:hypothetical protein